MMSFARSAVAALFCLVPFVGKADVWANFVDVCPAGYQAPAQTNAKGTQAGTPLQLGKWIDDSSYHSEENGLNHQAWDFIADETAGFKLRWSTYKVVGSEPGPNGEVFDVTVPVWYMSQGGYDGTGDWYGDIYEPRMEAGIVKFTNIGRVWIRMNPLHGDVDLILPQGTRNVDRVAIQWEVNTEPGVFRRQCLLDSADFAQVPGYESKLNVVDGLWLFEARKIWPDLKKTSLSFGHVVSLGDGITASVDPHDFEFGSVWTFDQNGDPVWYTGGYHWDPDPATSSDALLGPGISYNLNYIANGPPPTHCVPLPAGGCPPINVNTQYQTAGTLQRTFSKPSGEWEGTATITLGEAPNQTIIPPGTLSKVIHRYGYYGDGQGNQGVGLTPYLIDDATRSANAYAGDPHDETVGELPGRPSVSGGAAMYAIPIDVPPGRRGMQPDLSVSYSSRSGNGHMGMGFSLAGLSSISRCPPIADIDGVNGAITLSNNDRLCLDGERLLLASGSGYGAANSQYRTEIATHQKVVLNGGMGSSTSSFTVYMKDGTVRTYGTSADARLAPGGTVLTWALSSHADRFGNSIEYSYHNFGSEAELAIDEIRYSLPSATPRTVSFVYDLGGQRQDVRSSFVAGQRQMLSRRLDAIETYVGAKRAARYNFFYGYSRSTNRTLLMHATVCANEDIAAGDLPDIGATESCFELTNFSWSDEKPTRLLDIVGADQSTGQLPLDMEVDDDDLSCTPGQPCPAAPLGSLRQVGDFDGDGRREFKVVYYSGNLNNLQDEHYILSLNDSGDLLGKVALGPAQNFIELLGGRQQYIDVNNDGRVDVVGSRNGVMAIASWKDNASWANNNDCTNPNSVNCPFVLEDTDIPYTEPQGGMSPETALQDQFKAADFNRDGFTDLLIERQVDESFELHLLLQENGSTVSCSGLGQGKSTASIAQFCFVLANGTLVQPSGANSYPQPLETFRPRDVGAGGQSFTESLRLSRVDDINGDGDLEIVVSQPPDRTDVFHPDRQTDLIRSLAINPVTNAITIASFNLDDLVGITLHDTYHQFLDANGDGLQDLVYIPVWDEMNGNTGRLAQRTWRLRLNKGGALSSTLFGNNADEHDLQLNDGVTPLWQGWGESNPGMLPFGWSADMWRPKYANFIVAGDYDNDGRDELLFPTNLEASTCVTVVESGKEPPGVVACSQMVDNMATGPVVAPPIGDADIYGNFGVSHWDASVYGFSAMEFVEATDGTVTAEVVETEIAAGAGAHVDDYFGDGLNDVVSTIGCVLAEGCFSIDQNSGLFDEWHQSFFVNATFRERIKPRLAAISAVGYSLSNGTRSKASDIVPDLLISVDSPMLNQTRWSYAPLSASPVRPVVPGQSGSYIPLALYSVPADQLSRQIDQDHFYFTSSMYVVDEMAIGNGIWTESPLEQSENVLRYSYSEAVYNRRGRGFQGFRKIAVDDLMDSINGFDPNKNLRSVTQYSQAFPTAGRIQSSCSYKLVDSDNHLDCDESSAQPVMLSTMTWGTAPANAAGTIVFPQKQEQWQYDLDDRHEYASSVVEYLDTPSGYVDSFGNPYITSRTNTDTSIVSMISTQEFDYANDAGAWWVNKVIGIKNTYSADYAIGADPTDRVNSENFVYDPATRALQCIYRQTGSRVAPTTCSSAVFDSQDKYQYDQFGNIDEQRKRAVSLNAQQMEPDRIRTAYYGPDGYFPEWQSHFDGAIEHRSEFVHRPRDGQTWRVKSPNGRYTEIRYDPFGREIERAFTDQPISAVDVANLPSAYRPRISTRWHQADHLADVDEVYSITTLSDGAAPTVQYYNNRHQTQRGFITIDQFDGTAPDKILITDNEYYPSGHTYRQPKPVFEGEAFMRINHLDVDALGRVVDKRDQKFKEDNYRCVQKTLYEFEGLTTKIQALPSGNSYNRPCRELSLHINGMQRVIGTTGLVHKTVDAQGQTTEFRYDGMGNPIHITDPRMAVTEALYDGLGRRIWVNDPNAGFSVFEYNGFGEVIRNTAANGSVRTNAYDSMGRMISQQNEWPVDVDYTAWDYRYDFWEYDVCASENPSGGNCLGQIVTETTQDSSGLVVHRNTSFYDPLGRATEVRTEIRASDTGGGELETFSTRYAFDGNFDRIKGVQYPSGDVIYRSYSADGYPFEEGMLFESGKSRYVRRVLERDARGNAVDIEYRNQTREVFDYHEGSDQPRSIDLTFADGTTRKYEYTYDVYENMRSQKRTGATTTTEILQYDSLHRLQDSTRTWPGNSKFVDYNYDTTGNLTRKDDFAVNYVYVGGNSCDANEAPFGANQLRSIDLAVGGYTADYCYDRSGNLTSVQPAGGGNPIRRAKYDADNLPLWLAASGAASTFGYNASHQRYFQKTVSNSGTQETVYVDKLYERGLGDDFNAEKAYVGDYFVITRNFLDGAEYHIIHRDRLGSVAAISNRAGELVEETGFGPFGGTRDPDWSDGPYAAMGSDVSTRGFTQHEHLDSVGLIHMNGRAYDPLLGRFLSVDPFIQFPMNSQSLNPYSYIMNNPMAGTDPTGYSINGIGCEDRVGCNSFDSVKIRGYGAVAIGGGGNGKDFNGNTRQQRGQAVDPSSIGYTLPSPGSLPLPSIPPSIAPAIDIVSTPGGRAAIARAASLHLRAIPAGAAIGATVGVTLGVGTALLTYSSVLADGTLPYDMVVLNENSDDSKSIRQPSAPPIADTGGTPGGNGDDGDDPVDPIVAFFSGGQTPRASTLGQYAEQQGWVAQRTATGPIKYTDQNGIVRLTIKRGSSRTPGSGNPHVEVRNAQGVRIDPATGNPTARKSIGNHRAIEYDL